MINRDQINAHPATTAGYAAMAVIDAVQTRPAVTQLMGAAIAFLAMCDRVSMDAGDIARAARNLMNSNEHEGRPELRAVRAYVNGEL